MKYNQKLAVGAVVAVIGFMGLAGVSFAASGVVLTNAGLGQKTGDSAHFGVAICNEGGVSLATPAPLSLTANNVTVTAASISPLAAGACGYTYFSYASFGMSAGQTYSVQVAIDPAGTLGASVEVPVSYKVTVPPGGQVLGVSTVGETQAQQLLAQLASMVTILEALAAKAKALGL